MPLVPWAAGIASEGPHQLPTEISPDESKNINNTKIDHKGINDSATRHWPVPVLIESDFKTVVNV